MRYGFPELILRRECFQTQRLCLNADRLMRALELEIPS